MARKRYTPEQIIRKLREAEVFIAEGMTAAEAARKIGVRTLYIEPESLWRIDISNHSMGSYGMKC